MNTIKASGGMVALLFCALALSSVANAGPLQEATLRKVIHEVSIVSPSQGARAAAPGDVVKDDLGVRTGIKSRAELLFQDQTLTRLGPETFFSFETGTREMTLGKGTMLLQVPKNIGGARIHTAAVTASILGTTIMIEYLPGASLKVLVLEGTLRLSLNRRIGEAVLLHPGKMVIMKPDANRIPDPVDVDLRRLVQTSRLVNPQLFKGEKGDVAEPLPSTGLIEKEIAAQSGLKQHQGLFATNLVIPGQGTNIVLASDQQLASMDPRVQPQLYAQATPTPAPADPHPTPDNSQTTSDPLPTPPVVTPTPTPPVVTPTPTPPVATPTPTPPVATPTPTPPVATPTPTPPVATPTPTPPVATPTPTPPVATPTPTPPVATPTPTPPVATPTPTPVATPTPPAVAATPFPTPNLAAVAATPGTIRTVITLPVITATNALDASSAFQTGGTKPTLTISGTSHNGVVYHGSAQNGPAGKLLFGSETQFGAEVNLDGRLGTEYAHTFPAAGVAAFEVANITFNGAPTFNTAGGPTDIALIGENGISDGGNAIAWDLGAVHSLFLGTNQGSISFGSGSTLSAAAGSMLNSLHLYAGGQGGNKGNVVLNAAVSLPSANLFIDAQNNVTIGAAGSLVAVNAANMDVNGINAVTVNSALSGGGIQLWSNGQTTINGAVNATSFFGYGNTLQVNSNLTANNISIRTTKDFNMQQGAANSEITGENISLNAGGNLTLNAASTNNSTYFNLAGVKSFNATAGTLSLASNFDLPTGATGTLQVGTGGLQGSNYNIAGFNSLTVAGGGAEVDNLSVGGVTVTSGNLNVQGNLASDGINVKANLQVGGNVTPLSAALAGVMQTLTAGQLNANGSVSGFSSVALTGNGDSQTGALSAGSITDAQGNLATAGNVTADVVNVSGNLNVQGNVNPLSPSSAGITQTLTAGQLTTTGNVGGFSALDVTGAGTSQTGTISVASVTDAKGNLNVKGDLVSDDVNINGNLQVSGSIITLSAPSAGIMQTITAGQINTNQSVSGFASVDLTGGGGSQTGAMSVGTITLSNNANLQINGNLMVNSVNGGVNNLTVEGAINPLSAGLAGGISLGQLTATGAVTGFSSLNLTNGNSQTGAVSVGSLTLSNNAQLQVDGNLAANSVNGAGNNLTVQGSVSPVAAGAGGSFTVGQLTATGAVTGFSSLDLTNGQSQTGALSVGSISLTNANLQVNGNLAVDSVTGGGNLQVAGSITTFSSGSAGVLQTITIAQLNAGGNVIIGGDTILDVTGGGQSQTGNLSVGSVMLAHANLDVIGNLAVDNVSGGGTLQVSGSISPFSPASAGGTRSISIGQLNAGGSVAGYASLNLTGGGQSQTGALSVPSLTFQNGNLQVNGNLAADTISGGGNLQVTGAINTFSPAFAGVTQTITVGQLTTPDGISGYSILDLTGGGQSQTGALSVPSLTVAKGSLQVNGNLAADSITGGGNLQVAGSVNPFSASGAGVTQTITIGELTAGGSVLGFSSVNLSGGGQSQIGVLTVPTLTFAHGNLDVTGNLTADGITGGGTLQVGGNINPFSASGAGVTQMITVGQINASGSVLGFSSLDLTGGGQSQTGVLTAPTLTFANGNLAVNGNLSADGITGGGTLQVTGNVSPFSASGAGVTPTITVGQINASGSVLGFSSVVLTGGGQSQTGVLTAPTLTFANGNLNVNGNLTADSITGGGNLQVTGNISPYSASSAGVTQTITVGQLTATGNVSGFSSVVLSHGGSVLDLSTPTLTVKNGPFTVNGNLTAQTVGVTGNLSLTGAGGANDGNLSATTVDVTNGTLTAAGNLNVVDSVDVTNGSLIVNGTAPGAGNIFAPTVTVSGGGLTAVSIATVQNLKVSGNVLISGTGGISLASGTVGGLSSAGNLTSTGNLNVGNGGVAMTGSAPGLGNISASALTVTGGGLTATGNLNATSVNVTGNVNLTGAGAGNISANNVTVSGGGLAATGNLTVTNNVTVNNGNLSLTGTAAATGDLSANAVNVTNGNLTASGNVDASSVNAGGNVTLTGSAQGGGNLSAGSVTTGGNLTAAGNVNSDNLNVGGNLNVTGTMGPQTINPTSTMRTLSASSMVIGGGLNFKGLAEGGSGPGAGYQLTLTSPANVTFDTNAINGANFDGGDAALMGVNAGGDGGLLNIGTAADPIGGNVVINQPISASTGANAPSVATGGAGGTVNVYSNQAITVNSTIKVSSATAGRASASGGHVTLSSAQANSQNAAITVSNSAQILALLANAAPGPGGTIKFVSAGGSVNVNGATVQADQGTVDIRNNGANGAVNLTNANLNANVIKVGALGSNGQLTINGGAMNANSAIELYAGGSNGTVLFNGNVALNGNSMKTIAGNTVTISNGSTVNVGGSQPANVYTNNANYANYGGNGSTTGKFAGAGATTSAFSNRPAF